MEQYHWILSREELQRLKTGHALKDMYCKETMKYGGSIEFIIGMARTASVGSDQAKFVMKIQSLKEERCDGIYAVMVEEIDYIKNFNRFYDLPLYGDFGIWTFKTNELNNMETLTLHFAITFY